jgi:hypothetical protein
MLIDLSQGGLGWTLIAPYKAENSLGSENIPVSSQVQKASGFFFCI